MRKKLMIIIVPLLFVSLFNNIVYAGWFNEEMNSEVQIGFLLKTVKEERYLRDKRAFENKAQSLGVDVVFDAAANNENIQLSRFKRMLAKGVDVIVLQPVNTNTAGKMVKLAHKQGVKVIGYDTLLKNGPLDAHVMQNSWAVGKLQGREMLKWFKEKKGQIKGNVALIKGHPNDSNAVAMTSGAKKIIKEHSGLNLVAEKWHENWSSDRAMATTNRLLKKYDKIDAFICNNSGLASGVIAALKTRGLADTDKVFVAGSDADLKNIRYLVEGKQGVEIFKKIKPLAQRAAQVAYKVASNPNKSITEIIDYDRIINNGYQNIPTIITPIEKVTKDNIKETVVEIGFYQQQDIYNQKED
ncbi:D-xylose ABC transporter substrate-binding protein [Halanaerocella petrolearia]